MQLTEHFSLSEFVDSPTAQSKGIDNTPPPNVLENLKINAAGMERVRALLGSAIHINSGFRCAALNVAIGGSTKSDHMLGLATDFVCPGFGTPLQIARLLVQHKEEIGFKKLIMEHTWVHIAFPEAGQKPEFIVLTAHFGNGPTTYTPGLA